MKAHEALGLLFAVAGGCVYLTVHLVYAQCYRGFCPLYAVSCAGFIVIAVSAIMVYARGRKHG